MRSRIIPKEEQFSLGIPSWKAAGIGHNAAPTVKRLLQFLAMLGVNAVPALGWFVEGWGGGTTLAIYWFENVAACLFVAARIALHQHWNPLRGHFAHSPREGTKHGRGQSFLGGFTMISLVFSAAHGFFLAMIILVLTHNGKGDEVEFSLRDMGIGCGNVLVFLTVNFAADLPGLRKWTFLRIEQMAERNLARVIIVHMTIIFGMLGVAMTNATKAFFGVFIALKTMNDLNSVIPQWDPEKPPAWLCSIMNKIPSAHPGEKFEDFWVKDKAAERARRAANERPYQRG